MAYQDYDRTGRERWAEGRRPSDERGRYERERYGRERSWRDADRDRRDEEDRGFFERAGDEVRSWFGDDEAERRRREDERRYARESGSESWRDPPGYEQERWRGGAYGRSGGGFFTGDRAGDYGAGRGAGATGAWGLGAGHDRDLWGHDPYRSWRERQIRELDRDYDEYRREHQSRFEREFGTWRESRQQQRQSLGQVRPQQEVVGSDDKHIGTVDRVHGDRIVLTRSDPEAGGRHHSIPCAWIISVAEQVRVNKTADEAHAAWRDEENRRAMFGDEDRDRQEGPHILNRSFSGTY